MASSASQGAKTFYRDKNFLLHPWQSSLSLHWNICSYYIIGGYTAWNTSFKSSYLSVSSAPHKEKYPALKVSPMERPAEPYHQALLSALDTQESCPRTTGGNSPMNSFDTLLKAKEPKASECGEPQKYVCTFPHCPHRNRSSKSRLCTTHERDAFLCTVYGSKVAHRYWKKI